MLGLLYTKGLGVERDYIQAAEWYHRAASRGDTFAQSNLGLLYANGQGVKQDYVEAYKWFDLAATHGPSDSRGKASNNRQAVGAKLTPKQISEAQQLAAEWKPASQLGR